MSKPRWTTEEEEILLNNWKTHTAKQLVSLVSRHSPDAINRKLGRLGIVLTKEDVSWRAKYAQSHVDYDQLCKTDQSLTLGDLDVATLQVLLGSLLGDGCCNRQTPKSHNCRYCENHGLKQSEYLSWKKERLSIFKPKLYTRKNCVSLVTVTNPIFTKLRNEFYQEKRRKYRMPLEILDKLNLFGLMIWYLDDGHLSRGKYPSISAKGWDDGLNEFIEFANNKFNLSLYVYKCSHGNGVNKTVKVPSKNMWLIENWLYLAETNNIPSSILYKLQGGKDADRV